MSLLQHSVASLYILTNAVETHAAELVWPVDTVLRCPCNVFDVI